MTAPFGYNSQVSWKERLSNEYLTGSINGQINKSSQAIKQSISSQTREIVASNEALTQTFGKGFDVVNSTLEWGISNINNAVEYLRSDFSLGIEALRANFSLGIEALQADFNYGIGLLLSQLQVNNKVLLGILDKLDNINRTLENPTLTQAREFYRIGCDRMVKGLLDKALESFLKSREKNDVDFFTEYQIGNLYLYGRDEDDNVVDLQKAEDHLRDAFRYGNVEIVHEPGLTSMVAETAFHASIACYAQAVEFHQSGQEEEGKQKLKEAVNWAKKALKLSPDLSQSSYHLAKYYGSLVIPVVPLSI